MSSPATSYQIIVSNQIYWATLGDKLTVEKININAELAEPVGPWMPFFQPTVVPPNTRGSGTLQKDDGGVSGSFIMKLSDITWECQAKFTAGTGDPPTFNYSKVGNNKHGFALELQGPFVRGNTAMAFINIKDFKPPDPSIYQVNVANDTSINAELQEIDGPWDPFFQPKTVEQGFISSCGMLKAADGGVVGKFAIKSDDVKFTCELTYKSGAEGEPPSFNYTKAGINSKGLALKEQEPIVQCGGNTALSLINVVELAASTKPSAFQVTVSNCVNADAEMFVMDGPWDPFFKPSIASQGYHSTSGMLKAEEGGVSGNFAIKVSDGVKWECKAAYAAGSGQVPTFSSQELGENPNGFVLDQQGPFLNGNMAVVFLSIIKPDSNSSIDITVSNNGSGPEGVELVEASGNWDPFFQPATTKKGCYSRGRLSYERGEASGSFVIAANDVKWICEGAFTAGSNKPPEFNFRKEGDNSNGLVLEKRGPSVNGNCEALVYLNIIKKVLPAKPSVYEINISNKISTNAVTRVQEGNWNPSFEPYIVFQGFQSKAKLQNSSGGVSGNFTVSLSDVVWTCSASYNAGSGEPPTFKSSKEGSNSMNLVLKRENPTVNEETEAAMILLTIIESA